MRARDHLERPILVGDGIKVNPGGEHALEHLHGSFNVRHADFRGRFAETRAGQPVVADRDGQVLVPGERPALPRRFVEEQHPDQAER